ncbi:unnamed protein product, partial [Closterium sp. Naga37s-1]
MPTNTHLPSLLLSPLYIPATIVNPPAVGADPRLSSSPPPLSPHSLPGLSRACELVRVRARHRACELVRVSAGREETAGGVAQQMLRDQGVALAAGGTASLVFNGVELDERSTLDQCGIRSASGRESWVPRFVFPNAWHMQSVPRKPPVK